MKTSKLSLLLIVGMVTSMFLINNTIVSNATTGVLSSEVQAGDTYWYTVTDFPTFQQMIDVFGINDEMAMENLTLSSTGTLAGSDIYAKVLATNNEEMSYWDGNALTTGSLPTVDLSVGVITANDITFTATPTDGGAPSTSTLPAGSALPFPYLFGTTTQFNVSDLPDIMLETPLFLNDNYDLHTTIIQQMNAQANADGIGDIDVTNDASQFRIDVDLDVGDGVDLQGFASWRKTDGALQELNFEFYNNTSATTLLNYDIDIGTKEHKEVAVAVGDTFALTVSEANFNFVTAAIGNDMDKNDLDALLSDIKGNFTQLVGETLIDFKVVEVDQMYYRVEGSVFNGTDQPRIEFPEDNEEIWMVGFGRFGPGMPQNMLEMGPVSTSDYSSAEVKRHAMPGFVVSEDYDIYAAWDKTFDFLSKSAAISALDVLSQLPGLIDDPEDYLSFYSSTTDYPILNNDVTGATTSDGGYKTSINYSWDIMMDMNDTYNESYYDPINDTWYEVPTWDYFVANTSGQISAVSIYDNTGAYKEFTLSGGFDFGMKVFNATAMEGDLSISISDIVFSLDGNMTRVTPISTTNSTNTSTNGNVTTSSDTPLLNLPGFEFYITIFAIFVAIPIFRKRK